jgi:flagellar biosynthesis regulator FlbT
MKIFINIGYKRKGRMMLEIINDDIIKITVMYVDDDYRFKCTKELKKVLNKMVKLFNGICGSISHENTLSSIIKVDQLLRDNNIYGFYDIKWNYRVKSRI